MKQQKDTKTMPHDFNDAAEPRDFSDLIPDGTIAPCLFKIIPGRAGEGGWLTRSKEGDSEYLSFEITLLDGPYKNRKTWLRLTLNGTGEKYQKAGEISRSHIRGILESARGVKSSDTSKQAQKARRINSWADLDGLRCIGRIGIEKGRDGYKDKNVFEIAISPDKKEWQPIEQQAAPTQAAWLTAPAAAPKAAPAAAPGTKKPKKPAWAC
jgi:hypothetical protein